MQLAGPRDGVQHHLKQANMKMRALQNGMMMKPGKKQINNSKWPVATSLPSPSPCRQGVALSSLMLCPSRPPILPGPLWLSWAPGAALPAPVTQRGVKRTPEMLWGAENYLAMAQLLVLCSPSIVSITVLDLCLCSAPFMLLCIFGF